MDQLSQRARSLGGPYVSTLTEYLKQTCLSLRPYQGPNNHRIRVIDIESTPEFNEAFRERIPLIVINGRPAFRFRVDEVVLRRRLGRERG